MTLSLLVIKTSIDLDVAEMGWSPAGVPTLCWGPGLASSSLRQPPNLMEVLSLSLCTGSQQSSPHLLQTEQHILARICSIRALERFVFHLSQSLAWQLLEVSPAVPADPAPASRASLEGKRFGY